MLVSWRDYLRRTSESVDEIRDANSRLELANRDLHELFRFASGIAARAHDRSQLVLYTEEALSALTGGRITFTEQGGGESLEVRAGDVSPGFLSIEETPTFERHRGERLQPLTVPPLATAI